MAEEQIDFDLDDSTDDVKDIIGYSNPCDGIHLYKMAFSGLDNVGSSVEPIKGVRIIYQHLITEQKVNAEDLGVAPNSLFSERFTGNKVSKEWLKKRLLDCFGEVTGSFGPYILQLSNNKPIVRLTTKIVKTKGKGENKGRDFDNVRIQDLQIIADSDVTLPTSYTIFEYEPDLSEFS